MRKLILMFVAAAALGMAVMVVLSQRPGQIGLSDGALRVCSDPDHCLNSQLGPPETRVKPIYVGADVGFAWQQLQRLLSEESQGQLRRVDGAWMAATWRSGRTWIKCDLEFLLIQSAGVIHVRSASRLRTFGFGGHASAIVSIQVLLEEALLAEATGANASGTPKNGE